MEMLKRTMYRRKKPQVTDQATEDFLNDLESKLSELLDQKIRSTEPNGIKYNLHDRLPSFGGSYVSRVHRIQGIYQTVLKQSDSLIGSISAINTFRLQLLDQAPLPSPWYLDGQEIMNSIYDLIEETIKKNSDHQRIQRWWNNPVNSRTESNKADPYQRVTSF